jgi:hypothetical protein
MIICFRCTAETKAGLDTLLATGAYKTYDEAITASIRNQVLMEKEVTEKGVIIIGDPAAAPTPPTDEARSNGKTAAKRPVADAPVKEIPASRRHAERTALEVPALFRLEGFPKEVPRGLADLPPDMWSIGQMIPLDRWVLGQHNRLLPAKANARALVRLFLDSPKGLNITQAARIVAEQAAVLGDYLRYLDARHGMARDEALATAFPTTEQDEDSWLGVTNRDVLREFLAQKAAAAAKSRGRYANQFVVYENGRGELSGLMVDLRMIDVVQLRNERRIVPTRVAWEFAVLPNPLLDGIPDRLPEKFSGEERAFLISHILRSVPVEAFAYRVILEAVRDGQTSPEQIDPVLKVHLDEERAEDLSQSFFASQRSGAVSRMSDLGLIERRREGVRVNYAATEEGLAFLRECATKQPP